VLFTTDATQPPLHVHAAGLGVQVFGTPCDHRFADLTVVDETRSRRQRI